MKTFQPTDLAKEHGLSTQAIRNYEDNNCLPPANRTPAGYRIYTETHAAALRAYLALIHGFGHTNANTIMQSIHHGNITKALAIIGAGHNQLRRDYATLRMVQNARKHLTTPTPATSKSNHTIGELAHILDLSPATIRAWEKAGILTPHRNPTTGYRIYTEDDIRDARLAHLLRRGGYLLNQIATIITQIRSAGGTAELGKTIDHWHTKLTNQGLNMLTASGRLSDYLATQNQQMPDETSPANPMRKKPGEKPQRNSPGPH